MFNFIVRKIVGSKNQRVLRGMQPIVERINSLEEGFRAKSDTELREMTPAFKQRLDAGAGLDDLLPEAFAVVREAGRRVLGMRHFDMQMVGGMALHRGMISEMKTGEGKTLVATLPVYLNALAGRGVHLVTVNDYLARRDADWMGKLYRALGLSVGVIYHDMPETERKRAYRSDVTYGQNNEYGFDYLRDNMKDSIERYVQRELNFAIVDEVDSILIDEARTPLIISGPAEDAVDLYTRVDSIIPSLRKDVDYTVDEKANSAMLTDTGVESIERKLSINNLYDQANIQWLHHVQQALAAHTLYKRDVNYLVEEGEVLIIDEFTGRKMPGRRWSDGLHQAIEAKENVKIEQENQTLATITFQNYFRMYNKLGGMTGTAETEAEEFFKIYKLEVLVVPTNRDMIRADHHDVVYKSERGKFRHVVDEIVDCHERGQPVLVGTTSVEKSEVLAKMLRKRGIKHDVLNAKQHAREAEIVAQAGRKGAVTIATNMAGRGTDIVLGGNAEVMGQREIDADTDPDRYREVVEKYRAQCAAERQEVLAAGGLHILGTERHEARRIDNQLRGRSGRQGDPGSSRFYLSLEDDLLRIFGSDRISGMMGRLGMSDDEPIEHRFVTRAISNAQKKVEGHNFDIRKHLLEYDDVMNQQRKTIYALRREVLEGRYNPAGALSTDTSTVPTKSGRWTVDSLADRLQARVEQIINSFFDALQAHLDKVAAEGGTVTIDEMAHEQLTHELYRHFGAVVELRAEVKATDRQAAISKARSEVAASFVQQRERVLDASDTLIGDSVAVYCNEKVNTEQWDIKGLEEGLSNHFNAPISFDGVPLEQQALAEKAWEQVEKIFEAREEQLGPFFFLYFARHFMLDEIDTQWIDHLRNMDHLREGIGLRGYGQKDPKQEYKKEGYNLFAEMMGRLNANAIDKLFRVEVRSDDEALPQFQHKKRRMNAVKAELSTPFDRERDNEPVEKVQPIRRQQPRIGRNDPCYCGSGKKYKRCHMLADEAQGPT